MSALPDRDFIETRAELHVAEAPGAWCDGAMLEVLPEHDIIELFDAAYEDDQGELPYLRWPAVHRGELVENPRYKDPYRPPTVNELERRRREHAIAQLQSSLAAPPRQAPTAQRMREPSPHAGSSAPAAPPRLMELLAKVEKNREQLLEQVRRDRGTVTVRSTPAKPKPPSRAQRLKDEDREGAAAFMRLREKARKTLEKRVEREDLRARGIPPVPRPLRPKGKGSGHKTSLSIDALKRARELYYFDELNFVAVAEKLIEEGLHHGKRSVLQQIVRNQFARRNWPVYPRAKRSSGRPRKQPPRDRYLSDQNIADAYRLYFDQGLSMRKVAESIVDDTGYAAQRGTQQQIVLRCASALDSAFRHRGWKQRSQRDVTVARNLKHGHKRRDITHEEEVAYRHWLAEQRGWEKVSRPGRPQCKGVRQNYPGKGRRCQNSAMEDSDFCFSHDRAHQAAQAAHLETARRQEASLDAGPFIAWMRDGFAREGAAFFVKIGMATTVGYQFRAGAVRGRPITAISPERVAKYAGERELRRLYPNTPRTA